MEEIENQIDDESDGIPSTDEVVDLFKTPEVSESEVSDAEENEDELKVSGHMTLIKYLTNTLSQPAVR
jgi:hypothetical protein